MTVMVRAQGSLLHLPWMHGARQGCDTMAPWYFWKVLH